MPVAQEDQFRKQMASSIDTFLPCALCLILLLLNGCEQPVEHRNAESSAEGSNSESAITSTVSFLAYTSTVTAVATLGSTTISTSVTTEATEMFIGSMTFSSIALRKAQVSTSVQKSLAQDFSVDEAQVAVTVVESRRLEGLREARRLAGNWDISFTMSVPASEVAAVESTTSAIQSDSTSFNQAMSTHLQDLGVSESNAFIAISNFQCAQHQEDTTTTTSTVNGGIEDTTTSTSVSLLQPTTATTVNDGTEGTTTTISTIVLLLQTTTATTTTILTAPSTTTTTMTTTSSQKTTATTSMTASITATILTTTKSITTTIATTTANTMTTTVSTTTTNTTTTTTATTTTIASCPGTLFKARKLVPMPPPGIHPRLLFSSGELPALRQRLNGKVGQEVMKQIRLHTSLLRKGRSDAWDILPDAEKYFLIGGVKSWPRIGNVGLYDPSQVYAELIEGGTTLLQSQHPSNQGVLAAVLALEAFECLVDADTLGEVATSRLKNVSLALSTWANHAVDSFAARKYAFQLAYAYDLAYSSINASQRIAMRKVFVQYLIDLGGSNVQLDSYYGADLAPEAVTSNWCPLDTFKLFIAIAIEGETSDDSESMNSSVVDSFISGGMAALKSFHQYGFWESGAPYEGQGKNYLYAAHHVALARRGDNFFCHPHVHAYAHRWLPAIIQPWGHSSFAYDVLGGTGMDPEKGGYMVQANDPIGLKFMYPEDSEVDYVYRNYIQTEAILLNGSIATFIDVGENKVYARGDRVNNLMSLAAYVSDWNEDSGPTSTQSALQDSMDYLDLQGATLIARSSFTSAALSFQMHVRQDFGGHTHADRGSFSLSALGRIFVDIKSTAYGSSAGMHGPEFNGETLVDDLASKVTFQEGHKMRIPAKLSAWPPTLNGEATFITSDATYSYSNEWSWKDFAFGTNFIAENGWMQETATFNDFRHGDNKIAASFGDTPFSHFPDWVSAGMLEGIQKKEYNPMLQVYRTGGLVRGLHPYVLILEDIRKDEYMHTYKWRCPIASDLDVWVDEDLPIEAVNETDIVLAEPAATGNRRLLVRVLQAKGQLPLVNGRSVLAYRSLLTNDYGEVTTHLVIERTNTVAPEFLLLFFPFRAGDSLPETVYDEESLVVSTGSQVDVFNFTNRTSNVSDIYFREFVLRRNGSTLHDNVGRIEPVAIKSTWPCSCTIGWEATGTTQTPLVQPCSESTVFDFSTCVSPSEDSNAIVAACWNNYGLKTHVLNADGEAVAYGMCCNKVITVTAVTKSCSS